jgi:trans-2,3-dihydro-3-hydroxyanthranilate isomerase
MPEVALPLDVPWDPSPAQLRRYIVIDAFTDRVLEGNSLAVFMDGRDLTPAQMQRVARELNLSETVFLLDAEQGGDVRARIFTPTRELPFAGHPVLGTACVVAASCGLAEVRLETGAGTVPIDVRDRGEGVAFGRMQQPIPSWEPYAHDAELLRALGVERSGLPVEAYTNGPRHVYVELASEQAVADLRPDIGALGTIEVGVSCFAGSGTRWKTRMFAPALGVNEDPATGSAAGPLAVHLGRHGRIEFGQEIEIRQGAEIGRPSLLYARANGSPQRIESVEVAGSAVIVARGELTVR